MRCSKLILSGTYKGGRPAYSLGIIQRFVRRFVNRVLNIEFLNPTRWFETQLVREKRFDRKDTHLCFKCCGVPIHRRPALARIPTLLHTFSQSATLCDVRITQL